MENLLNDDVRAQVSEAFAELRAPVQVLFFGKEEDCHYCDDTRKLVEEVVELSDKLDLRAYDLVADADVATQFNVDKVPGLVIAAQNGDDIQDYGVRYSGIPSGHEFSSLIFDLLQVSGRDSGLNPKTRQFLSGLTEPIHLQVFVTPT